MEDRPLAHCRFNLFLVRPHSKRTQRSSDGELERERKRAQRYCKYYCQPGDSDSDGFSQELCEFPFFTLYSLLLLSFFLYLKMARDCSCTSVLLSSAHDFWGVVCGDIDCIN